MITEDQTNGHFDSLPMVRQTMILTLGSAS